MQFSPEFWLGTGIAFFLGFLAIAVGLRDMNPTWKKRLEWCCWLGAVMGLLIVALHLPTDIRQETGDLVRQPRINPIFGGFSIEAGSSGTFLLSTRYPEGKRLEVGQNQLIQLHATEQNTVTFSTKVLDKNNNVLVTVDKNHWTVFPHEIADWNYRNNALEVIGATGRVVLQLKMLSDRLQLQGEWWDARGGGERLVGNQSTHKSDMQALTLGFNPDDPRIVPIFRYPGAQHLGEFVYQLVPAATSRNDLMADDDLNILRIEVILFAISLFGLCVAPLMIFPALLLAQRRGRTLDQ